MGKKDKKKDKKKEKKVGVEKVDVKKPVTIILHVHLHNIPVTPVTSDNE